MSTTRSWFNTVLLTAILCMAILFFYPHHNPSADKVPTPPNTSTTIQFNVPQSQAHEYEQESDN